MAYGDDILDLFGADPEKAKSQAELLAQAMRSRRAAGTLGTIVGGPFAAAGKQFSGDADQMQQALVGAAQHRGTMDVQRQHYQNESEWRNAMLGINQQKANTAATAVGLKATEQGATRDMWGNPVLYNKHGGSVLPGASAAAAPQGAGKAPAVPGQQHGMLSPESLDQLAEQFYQTGNMPNVGRGMTATMIHTQIANRSAMLHPDANLSGNHAGYSADVGSLKRLQAQADSVNAFERTAMTNLDQFLQTAKGVVDTGSPLFNMPARKFAEKVAGDPKMTQFNVARQVAVQEIGKVLSGAMGNAAISDSARKEVEGLLSPDASLAQIEAAANILRRDMGNRKASFSAQIGEVRGRTAGKAPAAEAGATAAPRPRRTVGGETREWDGNAWVPVKG